MKLLEISDLLPFKNGITFNIQTDDRICTLCDTNEIGDEFYYLYKCTHFNDLRSRYLKRRYYTHPNMEKTKQLFNVTNKKEMLNLAKFIYQIVQHFKTN